MSDIINLRTYPFVYGSLNIYVANIGFQFKSHNLDTRRGHDLQVSLYRTSHA